MPPTAIATAAAPAAMDLLSLRENMETTPVLSMEWTQARALRCGCLKRRVGNS
jgi:hypothetical protein